MTPATQMSLFDQRLARRRELEAALAALDALEGLAARRRALAQAVADAPDAAAARPHLVLLATALDAEEAAERGAVVPPADNGATVFTCKRCGHVGMRDGPCPGCAAATPAPAPPACPVCGGSGTRKEYRGEPSQGHDVVPCDACRPAPSPGGELTERPPEPLDGLFVSPDAVIKAYCADKLSNVKKGPAAVTPVLVEGVPHVCTGYGGPNADGGACFAWLIPLVPLAAWEADSDNPKPSHQPQPDETNETAYRGRLVTVKGKKYVIEGKQAQRTVVWTEPKKVAGPPLSKSADAPSAVLQPAPPHRACRVCGAMEGGRNFLDPTLCAACEGFEPLGKHALLGDCRLTLWSHPDGRAVARAAPGELGNWHDDDGPDLASFTSEAENVPSAPDLLDALAPLCGSGGPLEIDDCHLLEDGTLVISLGPVPAKPAAGGLFGDTTKAPTPREENA